MLPRCVLLALTIGTAGLVAATSLLRDDPGAVTPPALAGGADVVPRPRLPPDRARFNRAAAAAARPVDLDHEIKRLGARAPRFPDAVRAAYDQSSNLAALVHDILPRAVGRDPAAEYHLYSALEECRDYLMHAPDFAWAVYEQIMAREAARPTDELALADREYRRCEAFGGTPVAAIAAAMGEDLPGVAVEYASIWIERAAADGYPPALADLGLRPYPFEPGERAALLQEAVAGGDPDVLWRVFGQASTQGTETDARAAAWLIAACRAGLDCRETATWYRAWMCAIEGTEPCARSVSAVEHFWYALAPEERPLAWELALALEADLAAGRLDALPWPRLPGET